MVLVHMTWWQPFHGMAPMSIHLQAIPKLGTDISPWRLDQETSDDLPPLFSPIIAPQPWYTEKTYVDHLMASSWSVYHVARPWPIISSFQKSGQSGILGMAPLRPVYEHGECSNLSESDLSISALFITKRNGGKLPYGFHGNNTAIRSTLTPDSRPDLELS